MVYTYVPNVVSIGLLCRPLASKNPKFCRFWTLAFCGVASWPQSEKVEHRTCAQLQTFPYPTVSKSFLYSNAFMGKSGAQSLTFKSVMNIQTDRKQTDKKLYVFGRPGGG